MQRKNKPLTAMDDEVHLTMLTAIYSVENLDTLGMFDTDALDNIYYYFNEYPQAEVYFTKQLARQVIASVNVAYHVNQLEITDELMEYMALKAILRVVYKNRHVFTVPDPTLLIDGHIHAAANDEMVYIELLKQGPRSIREAMRQFALSIPPKTRKIL